MTPEQIEIERKKFEKVYIERFGWHHCFERTIDGDKYEYQDVETAFNVWLACCESRESVCVVLPRRKEEKFGEDLSIRYVKQGYNECLSKVKYWLQSSGISYREEE